MNYNEVFLFLLIIFGVLLLNEFFKVFSVNFILSLIGLFSLGFTIINNNLWHLNFLSNELWRIGLLILILISFIVIHNMNATENFEVSILNIMVLLASSSIILSDHLIVIYLGLELQTFSLFILIAKNKISIKSSEASLKYFILGALSSGLLLLGISFIFSVNLSLNIKDIYLAQVFENYNVKIASVLICLALFFKLALFPLHFWISDVYEGSSWDTIVTLSTLPKISVLSIIIQLLSYTEFFLLCSLGSIIIGSLGALNQTKFKRLLAYSGISHMGFILLGITMISSQGYEASFFYVLVYVINMLGLLLLIEKTFFSRNHYLIELSGHNLSNKIIALSWGILFLSIAGIPPLSGFINKWLILITILDNNYVLSSIIVVLFSAIAASYYLRIVKISYFQKNSSYLNWEYILTPKKDISSFKEYLIGVSIYTSLFLIINPAILFSTLFILFNYSF